MTERQAEGSSEYAAGVPNMISQLYLYNSLFQKFLETEINSRGTYVATKQKNWSNSEGIAESGAMDYHK